MKLSELKKQIDFHLSKGEDLDITIQIEPDGRMGSSTVYVSHADVGFDWESGQLVLLPKKN